MKALIIYVALIFIIGCSVPSESSEIAKDDEYTIEYTESRIADLAFQMNELQTLIERGEENGITDPNTEKRRDLFKELAEQLEYWQNEKEKLEGA